MKVYKQETEQGQLQELIFRHEGGESLDDFKQAVKVWLAENQPSIDWEEFFNRLIVLENSRIVLNMK